MEVGAVASVADIQGVDAGSVVGETGFGDAQANTSVCAGYYSRLVYTYAGDRVVQGVKAYWR